ncbi:hypothetical protein ACJX0J_010064, partial [Zea mays]
RVYEGIFRLLLIFFFILLQFCYYGIWSISGCCHRLGVKRIFKGNKQDNLLWHVLKGFLLSTENLITCIFLREDMLQPEHASMIAFYPIPICLGQKGFVVVELILASSTFSGFIVLLPIHFNHVITGGHPKTLTGTNSRRIFAACYISYSWEAGIILYAGILADPKEEKKPLISSIVFHFRLDEMAICELGSALGAVEEVDLKALEMQNCVRASEKHKMINTPQEEVDDKKEDANEKKGKQKSDSDAQKWIEDGILDEGNDIDWIKIEFLKELICDEKPILVRRYHDCFDVREQEKKILFGTLLIDDPTSGTRIYNKRDFKYELRKQNNVDMARLGEEDKSFLTSPFSIHEIHNVRPWYILDSVVALHEILHEKAYDKVNWQFLHQMGGKVAVRTNDTMGPYFNTHKGVRQGDPFSPLLFNIAADGLACLFILILFEQIALRVKELYSDIFTCPQYEMGFYGGKNEQKIRNYMLSLFLAPKLVLKKWDTFRKRMKYHLRMCSDIHLSQEIDRIALYLPTTPGTENLHADLDMERLPSTRRDV